MVDQSAAFAKSLFEKPKATPGEGTPGLQQATEIAMRCRLGALTGRIFKQALKVLQGCSEAKYGRPLLKKLIAAEEFSRRIHRFYCDSFEDVCELCKELHRTVVEPLDVGLVNERSGRPNAAKANQEKPGSIKRLALWLDSVGVDGRHVTSPVAAVYELRIADAQAKEADVRVSLELLGIPQDSQEYQGICFTTIGLVANCVADLAASIEPQTRSAPPKP